MGLSLKCYFISEEDSERDFLLHLCGLKMKFFSYMLRISTNFQVKGQYLSFNGTKAKC